MTSALLIIAAIYAAPSMDKRTREGLSGFMLILGTLSLAADIAWAIK